MPIGVTPRALIIAGALISLSIGNPKPALAYQVSPMTGELDLSKQSFYLLTLKNDNTMTVPIKISPVLRSQDANGKEVRTPTEDLKVFPQQLMLKPNETRTVRVTIKNKSTPDVERAYRLLVEQVPANDEPLKQTGLKFRSSYATAVYILPKRPRAELKIVAATREENGFSVSLKNTGNIHTILTKPSFRFSQGNIVQTLDDLNLLQPLSTTNYLAGSTHTLRWNWPQNAESPKFDLTRSFELNIEWECPRCSEARPSLVIKFE